MSNGWGMWVTFFLPAFLGGFLLGGSTILMMLRSMRKKSRAQSHAPAAARVRRKNALPEDVLLPLEAPEEAVCRMRAA